MTTALQKLHIADRIVVRCSLTRCLRHNLSPTSHRQPPTSTRLLQGTALLPTTITRYNPSHSRSRSNRNTQVVRASFLGVGAPEAILVGVVALIVFGPKGLAQAAKSLGATLRAFQPTIRELTQVSNELKSTLEQEIGINEIRQEFNNPPSVPTPLPKRDEINSVDDNDKQSGGLSSVADNLTSSIKGAKDAAAETLDPDIVMKREDAAKMAWGGAAAAMTTGGGIDGMSIEELEAELQRRKASANVPKELSSED